MNINIGLQLCLEPPEAARLGRLQALFAQACNQLAQTAQQGRCWNRVALHHQAYRQLRDQYPQLGSQMTCNAIYAVCRACRIVYQGQQSPFNVRLRSDAALPLIRFMPQAPVYFDRHTLSLKDGVASIFTLEGRLRCPVDVTLTQRARLKSSRVVEIALYLRDGRYELDFSLQSLPHAVAAGAALSRQSRPARLPEHVQIQDRFDPPVGGPPEPPSSLLS